MRGASRRGSAGAARRAGAALVLASATIAVASGSAAGAHAARTQQITDYARLSLVSADGNTLVERGRVSGNLPGTVEVSLTLSNGTASSSFTIRTRGGTISGHGQGKLKTGRAGYDSFGGWVIVARGTGRFRGATGKGGMYGSIYRVNDALSVEVTGRLRT